MKSASSGDVLSMAVPAQKSDVPGLLALLGSCVPHVSPQTVWELPWTATHYHIIRDARGTIVAAGSLQPINESCSEIRGLAVHRKWRGRGLARAIVQHLIEVAHAQGLTTVCVTRKPEFFRQFGFEDTMASWLQIARRQSLPSKEPRVGMILPARAAA